MTRGYTLVFYDGHCGLCHRAVLFALRRDTDGSRFRFAPLQGTTYSSEVSSHDDTGISDSIVALGANGTLLQQSDALILMLEEIGGGWRQLGRGLAAVPRFLRNLAYRGIANIRHLVFRRPADLCPLLPPTLQDRFLP